MVFFFASKCTCVTVRGVSVQILLRHRTDFDSGADSFCSKNGGTLWFKRVSVLNQVVFRPQSGLANIHSAWILDKKKPFGKNQEQGSTKDKRQTITIWTQHRWNCFVCDTVLKPDDFPETNNKKLFPLFLLYSRFGTMCSAGAESDSDCGFRNKKKFGLCNLQKTPFPLQCFCFQLPTKYIQQSGFPDPFPFGDLPNTLKEIDWKSHTGQIVVENQSEFKISTHKCLFSN